MRRFTFGAVVSIAALAAANPAISADLDYPDEMRGTYNDWDAPQDPLMDFEAGLRYGYSLGRVRVNDVPASGNVHAYDDFSHKVEAHFKINDRYTNSYLKANAGYSILLDSTYSSAGGSGTSNLGNLAHFTTDFGYAFLAKENDENSAKLSGFIGYQYMQEGHDVDGNAALSTSGVDLNALRLGFNAQGQVQNISVEADFAVLPYVMVSGETGVAGIATPVSLSGAGWGASADVMANVMLNDNLSAGLGARATYVSARGKYSYAAVNGDVSSMSLWRYGILAELKAHF